MTQSEKYAELLKKLNACEEARREAQGKSLREAWTTCQRGDRMLWLAARMIGQPGWSPHQQVVLAVCACVELSLKYALAGEERPAWATEMGRRWARGEATLAEVRAADAAGAYAASAAAYAAAYASAADAVNAAADAAADAADAAGAYAKTQALAASADIVRSMLTIPEELP